MRPKLWFFSYSMASQSVRQLVDKLPARIIKRERSKYRQRPGDIIINWGTYSCPFYPTVNSNEAIAKASSKLKTFEALAEAGVRVPEWTTDRAVAQAWTAKGKVLGRDLDRGSQGRGITVYEKQAELGPHRFYTRYMRKDREIRVHIFRGKVIFEQEKLRKHGVDADPHIASHARGWCFAFTHLVDKPVPEQVRQVAQSAVNALGLDFGAVDCVWNDRTGLATVLEVNTAPGIEESTLDAYVRAFNDLMR